MYAGVVLGPPAVFLAEVVVLYLAGSYAMGRLAALSMSGGTAGLGSAGFYLLVFPGVVLHELAHYLACLLTGTRVVRFAPFAPQSSADGRMVLGYVVHERRAFPVRAVIGLAPLVLNPGGILLATAILTPLSFEEVVNSSVETMLEGVIESGYLAQNPFLAVAWVYLCVSFALGSVPSREDLASVPAALLVFASGVVLLGFAREGAGEAFPAALNDVSELAAGLYALPALVAVSSAVVAGLWAREGRR